MMSLVEALLAPICDARSLQLLRTASGDLLKYKHISMAPKRAKAQQTKARPNQDSTAASGKDKSETKKRKNEAAEVDESKKIQRRSGRGGSSRPSQEQLLNFLLSTEAEDLTRPDDEVEHIRQKGSLKTYSSSTMNPFEELMCAIILSRPISHRLGLRTIRTVLNDPYNFTSAKAIQDAGSEKQHQALWDAKTQHKDKTAQQLGQLADVVLDKFTDKGDPDGTELDIVLKGTDDDVDKVRESLKSAINGLGATGLDIFCRRVQWLWDSAFPFIDSRTVDSLRKFSLPYDPEELEKLVNDNWKKLDTKHLAGSGDAQKKRRAFVVVLERVTVADLEGKVETVLSHAGS